MQRRHVSARASRGGEARPHERHDEVCDERRSPPCRRRRRDDDGHGQIDHVPLAMKSRNSLTIDIPSSLSAARAADQASAAVCTARASPCRCSHALLREAPANLGVRPRLLGVRGKKSGRYVNCRARGQRTTGENSAASTSRRAAASIGSSSEQPQARAARRRGAKQYHQVQSAMWASVSSSERRSGAGFRPAPPRESGRGETHAADHLPPEATCAATSSSPSA